MDFAQMALDLIREASRVGLKISINKAQILSLADNHALFLFTVLGRASKSSDSFVDCNTELHVACRINSSKFTFAVLSKILKRNFLNTNVKLKLFRANSLSAILK